MAPSYLFQISHNKILKGSRATMPHKVMDNLFTRFRVSHELTVLRGTNRKKEIKTFEHQIGTSLFSL